MGGSSSLISTVFSAVSGLAGGGRQKNSSRDLAEERAAREAEQEAKEAEDRKRDRSKVKEARQLEKKREGKSLLSRGAAYLEDEPETAAARLKAKLGE